MCSSVRHGLVVRISGSHPGGPGSIPGVGNLFFTFFVPGKPFQPNIMLHVSIVDS